MTIVDKIKNLFRRRPPTEEELAARADVEHMREHMREEAASQRSGKGATGWPSDTFKE